MTIYTRFSSLLPRPLVLLFSGLYALVKQTTLHYRALIWDDTNDSFFLFYASMKLIRRDNMSIIAQAS